MIGVELGADHLQALVLGLPAMNQLSQWLTAYSSQYVI